MIFINYNELCRDVIKWSERLPRNLDLIVGLPRSGMIPATILALHRNIALSDIDTFVCGAIFEGGFRDQKRDIKNVLVIDDSLLSGRSLIAASKKLQIKTEFNIYYGAVYAKPGSGNPAWLHYRKLNIPRVFEWNMFHSYWTQRCCMDIDGVLCRDPTREENDDSLRYRKFLHTVTPRHLPTVQVHTFITSRLEKYRVDTEKWLERHNVTFQKLIMHPAATKQKRIKAKDHAARKAAAYYKSGTRLFIESCDTQAREIHRLTHLPVICTDTMRLYA